MFVRLEKINPEKRQRRYYKMRVARTLFGRWCVIREWGRIGRAGGQMRTDDAPNQAAAEAALTQLCTEKCRKGYLQIRAG
ncbi:WGR domain-containing protein [Aliiroseovarius sp. KMU-50]|uniref:WGR domain-containing protein n=1 Tax=Aliiroseovarius salicola TaxID=3009082 RepID=A0ABT4W6P9_9RHOB|nr:WGR domain-containing protein [Aliiroseovarius sp. KMU-50]MDA5095612.1 WGR domain-containing protein [Aliiroseovarius sp. KMU-50]